MLLDIVSPWDVGECWGPQFPKKCTKSVLKTGFSASYPGVALICATPQGTGEHKSCIELS